MPPVEPAAAYAFSASVIGVRTKTGISRVVFFW
jgi:hypothetical protein